MEGEVMEDKTTDAWVTADESQVRHLWQCPECGRETFVNSDFYSLGGTPLCTVIYDGDNYCDCDMDYVRTEINTAQKEVK